MIGRNSLKRCRLGQFTRDPGCFMTCSMTSSMTLTLALAIVAAGGIGSPVFAADPDPAGPSVDAEYTIDFDATWSAATHPRDFPPNPHFSGLIGGTHDDMVRFWRPGGIATEGIRRMAESGSKSPLNTEVEAAIAAGTAGEVISGGGIGRSPGRAMARFTVTPEFPLVTLVSMIAPSPDWFVGVTALDLRDGGEWARGVVVELLPWDAGTDSGVTFTSANQVTSPRQPIALITRFPLPDGMPLGTFTFRRVSPPPVDASFVRGDANADGELDVSDAVTGLVWLFAGGVQLECEKAADVNDSGTIDITDAIHTLDWLFRGGPSPASPLSCGPDETPDDLSCNVFMPCMQPTLGG